ncbi:MAG: autotransporter domain-containing protein [Deltaproteobacteria bacterium]|jgi:outer membrane autotransporter protein|nr:autotransporter domain-containing protein [Deltaproteobacteria bacterium]
MEHRQKSWGGITLVTASLVLILAATLSLGGGVAWAQNVTNGSSGNITIDSGNLTYGTNSSTWTINVPVDLEQGYLNATANISVTNSSITNVSNITAGGNLVIDGTNGATKIEINGSTSASGGNITVGGGIYITNASIDDTGDGTFNTTITAGGDITLSKGNITGNVSYINSTDGHVIADNKSLINITGTITANKSIQITNESVVWGNNITVTEGDLNVSGGSVLNSTGNITANKSVYVNESSVIAAGNLVSTEGGIIIDNANNVSVVNISGNTTVAITGSNVSASNIFSTEGDIEIIEAENVTVVGNIEAAETVSITGGANVSAGNITANQSVSISGITNLTVANDITANHSVYIVDSNVKTGNITATNEDITIENAKNLTVDDTIFANLSVDINGATILDVTNITARNEDVTISGVDDLTVDGTISANNSVVLKNSVNASLVNITTAHGNITLSNIQNATLTGNITSNQGITINATKLNVTTNGVNISAAGDNLIINNSDIIRDSSVTDLTLSTFTNQSLYIQGNSNVNVTLIENDNGSVNIFGGNNYLGEIKGTNSNLSISGGQNIIDNLTITGDTAGGGGYSGNVSISAGNNTFANISIENGSLVLSDTSNNTFNEDIDIINGSLISEAAYNDITANITVNDGKIEFLAGETTLGTINISLITPTALGTSNNLTVVSGDAKVILASNSNVTFSTTNAGFKVESGAELFSNGSGVNYITDGDVIVGGAAILNVGASQLIVDPSSSHFVNLTDNSILAVGLDGSLNATVKASGKILLNLTDLANIDRYEDQTIINGTVTNETAGTYFYNPFYGRYDVPTTPGPDLVLGDYLGATGALAYIAEEGDFKYTKNMRSAASLIDRINDAASAISNPNHPTVVLSGKLIQALTAGAFAATNGEGAIVETIIRQSIGEVTLGVKNAVVSSVFKANSVVLGRLDKIHTADLKTPPAAGEGLLNRVWVGGFGSWAKQDDTDDQAGYKYDIGGFGLGYDRTFDGVPGLVLGISTAFSFGEVKPNHDLAKIDTDTISIGLYGSYKFDNGLFIDGTFAYGHSENDSEVRVPLLGTKHGSFDIDTWQFGVRGGWILKAGSFEITPSLGVRYLHLKNDGWREKSTNPLAINNFFKGYTDDLVEIPLQVKINTTIDTAGIKITPELRLGWTYAASELDNKVDVGLVGFSGTTPIWGIKQERNSFQVGTGIKIEINESLDIFANYDLDVSKDYRNHQASVGIGFEF